MCTGTCSSRSVCTHTLCLKTRQEREDELVFILTVLYQCTVHKAADQGDVQFVVLLHYSMDYPQRAKFIPNQKGGRNVQDENNLYTENCGRTDLSKIS